MQVQKFQILFQIKKFLIQFINYSISTKYLLCIYLYICYSNKKNKFLNNIIFKRDTHYLYGFIFNIHIKMYPAKWSSPINPHYVDYVRLISSVRWNIVSLAYG